MSHPPTRRDMNMFGVAALGGMLAGTFALPGCQNNISTKTTDKEPHICRGLNACKGNGADGKNRCAGTGSCATVETHVCKGHNACKGQGGCGANPGENECRSKGLCAMPLMAEGWRKARYTFEERMAKNNKGFGAAPEPKLYE